MRSSDVSTPSNRRSNGLRDGRTLGNAELLSVKDEVLLLRARPETRRQPRITSGKRSIGRAGAIARSWELRASVSLARHPRGQGHFADKLALLRPAYHRFTEGFDTADLKSATVLLDTLTLG
jgi:predicted ATPase